MPERSGAFFHWSFLVSSADYMDLISILVLGLVQGIAEWLPISSKTLDSVVYLSLFHGERSAVVPLLLWLHIGTVAAAMIYFRKEIGQLMMRGWAGKHEPLKLLASEYGFFLSALAMTTLVGVPLLLLQKRLLPQLDASLLMVVMGAGLLFTAFLLYSQKGKIQNRPTHACTWKDGLLVGALQGFSTLPGVSRSGTSTTGLVWRGFSSLSAFELSFLLSIPTVMGGEILLWGYDFMQAGPSSFGALPLLDGLLLALTSFIIGFVTIGALLKLARRINLWQLAGAFGLLMLGVGLARLG